MMEDRAKAKKVIDASLTEEDIRAQVEHMKAAGLLTGEIVVFGSVEEGNKPATAAQLSAAFLQGKAVKTGEYKNRSQRRNILNKTKKGGIKALFKK